MKLILTGFVVLTFTQMVLASVAKDCAQLIRVNKADILNIKGQDRETQVVLLRLADKVHQVLMKKAKFREDSYEDVKKLLEREQMLRECGIYYGDESIEDLISES